MLVPAQEIVFDGADRESVLGEFDRLLTAGRLSSGVNVERLEEEFAAYTGSRHGVAVSSGTTALELIFLALPVAGRSVLMPANTNFATFLAARRSGAEVILVDVDPDTLAPRLTDLIGAARDDTAAVVAVHLGGIISPELSAVADWCARSGIALVEDAAHAHGSRRDGRHAGTYGTAGAFSFFATKVMAGGEGGLVVTDDDRLAAEIRLLRNLGKADPWVSRHTRIGTNGRMTEFAAVVVRQQLRRLDENVAARRRIAERYRERLAGTVGLPLLDPGHPYSGYKVLGYLPAGTDRAALKKAVAADGVQLAGEVYEIPLHQQPVLHDEYGRLRLPGAEFSCARQLCLPVYPTLDDARLDRVVDVLRTHLPADPGR